MKKQLLICGLAVALLSGCSTNTSNLRFGTAGMGGTYSAFGSAFTNIVSSINPDYTFELKSTAGSSANLRLLSENYVQMAVAQTDLTNDAYFGTGIFENTDTYQGYGAIAGLYTETCQIVVRDDSGIDTIEDLEGKKVSVGEKESGTEQNAKQILSANGLSDQWVETVNLNYTTSANQLESKEIDAFFCTAGIQTTIIEQLAQRCDIRFLEIDEDCSQKLISGYGFYTESTIPANSYTGQDEDIQTVGIQSILLASDQLSEESVKEMTKILFEHAEEIQYAMPLDLQLDPEISSKGITIPFHPGAAAYYKEQGIDVKTDE